MALGASTVLSAYLLGSGASQGSFLGAGLFCLTPLLVAIRFVAPLQAGLWGLVWGVSVFAFGSGQGGAVPSTVGAALLLAGIPAAYTYLGSLLTRSRMGFSPLVLGALWVVVELALSPLSLRFGLLSGGLADGGALHVAGSLLGYGLIAFLIAYVNGLVLTLLTHAGIRIPRPRYVSACGDIGALLDMAAEVLSSRRYVGAVQPRAPPIFN